MPGIPEGYTYKRCDQYTAEEFIAMYQSKETKERCIQYVKDNPKPVYNTDDEIAIHKLFRDAVVNSLGPRKTTKRYKINQDR